MQNGVNYSMLPFFKKRWEKYMGVCMYLIVHAQTVPRMMFHKCIITCLRGKVLGWTSRDKGCFYTIVKCTASGAKMPVIQFHLPCCMM